MNPSKRPRCPYREERGLWAPLKCGREEGHTGVHIDFRPNVSIGFGPLTAPSRLATEGSGPTCSSCGGTLLARKKRRVYYCRTCKTNAPMTPDDRSCLAHRGKVAGGKGLTTPGRKAMRPA